LRQKKPKSRSEGFYKKRLKHGKPPLEAVGIKPGSLRWWPAFARRERKKRPIIPVKNIRTQKARYDRDDSMRKKGLMDRLGRQAVRRNPTEKAHRERL